MEAIRLSLIVPCRDKNDPKLKELLASIEMQNFPKKQLEVLVITDGTSESAKAIGIRKAKGEVIGFLASDNELTSDFVLNDLWWKASVHGSAYPIYYSYDKKDSPLERYFALFGMNDPLAFYMKKCDRLPHFNTKPEWEFNPVGTTVGDNGFFIKKELIASTDLDNYYHIDNANEACVPHAVSREGIKHKTGSNIFTFFAKRYRYGLQHAFNNNRRWHLVDFSKPKDIWRFAWFIIFTLTLIQPLCLSLRGYRKIRDIAWFYHPIVCLMAFLTYTALMTHLALRRLSRLLFAPMGGARA